MRPPLARFFACSLAPLATLAFAAGTAAAFAAPAAQPDPAKTFSDTLCPEATDPVRKLYSMTDPNTPALDFLAQINAVIDSYERCRTQKVSDGAVREMQYAETRLAQFHYQAGHIQRLLDQPDDAKKSLGAALDLASDVANWTPQSQSIYRSNNVGVGAGSSHAALGDKSVYHDSAVAIREAATKELALVGAPTGAASPAPVASP